MICASETGYWDSLYQRAEYAYGTDPSPFLVAQSFRLRRGMKALVPGDGEGRNSVWLASQGLEVDAIEASRRGIQKARFLAMQQQVSLAFHCCDLLDYPWSREKFDVLVSIYVHLPPHTRPTIHRNFALSLKPRGLLILEAFRGVLDETAAQFDPCLFSAELLRGDFADLEIIELRETTASMNDGFMHQGSADVVMLLARRP